MIWHVLELVMLGALAALAVLLIAVMRQVGTILIHLNPGRTGEVDGGPEIDAIVHVPGLPDGSATVVVFVSPTCTLCGFLQPALPAIRAHYPEVRVLPVVLGDDERARRAYADRLGEGARHDLLELAKEWNVQGTPFAVGINDAGQVKGRGVVNSLDHLEGLAETLLLSSVEAAAAAEAELAAQSSNGRPEERASV